MMNNLRRCCFLLALGLFSLLLFWSPTAAHAAAGPHGEILQRGDCGKTGGEVTYTWYDDGTLVVSGDGEMADYLAVDEYGNYFLVSTPWEAFNSDIKALIIEPGVTSVGKAAFMDCKALESVDLPEGLLAVRDSAFHNCTALTEIRLPKTVETLEEYAFRDSGLTQARVYYSLSWDSGYEIFPTYTCVVLRYGKALTPEPPLPVTRTEPAVSNNIHGQNYDAAWSSTVKSYLFAGEDGTFYRVDQSEQDRERVLVMEQYDETGRFLRGWDIPWELSVFGGFYAGSDGYYFVFGEYNGSDRDDAEVIRVVKYSKNLERLGAASLSGISVHAPFNNASLRMDEGDGILYVHTGRLMYRDSDGLCHQANLTFSIDTGNMDVLFVKYRLSNWTSGYVSHSFNQFIKADGDTVVRMDQGDSALRGVYLVRTSPSLRSQVEYGIAFEFCYDPNININHTGANLGGFEVSGGKYLIALSSIDQTRLVLDAPRNVYLLAVDKDLSRLEEDEGGPHLLKNRKCIQVTDYREGGGCDAACPQLVKISDGKFALLWEERLADPEHSYGYSTAKGTTGEVCCAFFDGEGNQLSEICRIPGALSDCQPVVINGDITWYVTKNSQPVFYRIHTGGVRACVPSGGSERAALLDPEGMLKGCESVYAARYNAQGQMTGLACGRVDGGRAVLDQAVTGDWTLFFLDSQGKPVYPKVPVSEG